MRCWFTRSAETICSNIFAPKSRAVSSRLYRPEDSRRAFEQLVRLETEMRDSGTVYRCPSGQHDDLGISLAMLVWAARHPHLETWVGRSNAARRRPRRNVRPRARWPGPEPHPWVRKSPQRLIFYDLVFISGHSPARVARRGDTVRACRDGSREERRRCPCRDE